MCHVGSLCVNKIPTSISNGKWEIEAMVCYSYYMALTVVIAQLHYTSTLPWNIRYAWSLRVPPGPGTTRNGSLLFLGPGVTHHPWSYGQAGTLPSDVYVQWRVKVKAFLLSIVSLIFGVACSAIIQQWHKFINQLFPAHTYEQKYLWDNPYKRTSLQLKAVQMFIFHGTEGVLCSRTTNAFNEIKCAG